MKRLRKVFADLAKRLGARGPISPAGLEVVASIKQSGIEKAVVVPADKTVSFRELSEPVLKFTKCGHHGPDRFEMKLGGSIITEVPSKLVKEVSGERVVENLLCPKCHFEKTQTSAIKCCLCGEMILPGDGVALYHKSSRGIKKSQATFVGGNAVGCLGGDCCPSGGFFAGHWTYDGFKSAFGGRTIAEEAMATGKPVFHNT